MKYASFLCLLAFLAACGAPSDPAKNATISPEVELDSLDKAIARSTEIDKTRAERYILLAETQAEALKTVNQDKYTEWLLKAAGVAVTVENGQKAVSLYKKVAEELPQHPKAPTALFMTGFVYENLLNDLPMAKSAYENFLKTYPDDPDYRDDAETALKMLGKSPDEIIEGFKEK